MAQAGVKTTELDAAALADEVVVNREGATRRQAIGDLGGQLAGSGPVADAFEELRSQITSGLVSTATWADLMALSASVEGTGAEVLDGDAGTHSQATATGYDGATVANAGRYSWNNSWERWVRIGDTGLTGKAPLASPAFTGSPTAPTATAGDDSTLIATTAFVQLALAALIDAAPGALDTLNELAAALGDDPNFASTVTASLAAKAPLASAALTGTPTTPTAAPGTDTTQLANTAFVQAALDALVDAAPGALDTLNELSAALNDDPDFATTVTNALAAKANAADLGTAAAEDVEAFATAAQGATADAAAEGLATEVRTRSAVGRPDYRTARMYGAYPVAEVDRRKQLLAAFDPASERRVFAGTIDIEPAPYRTAYRDGMRAVVRSTNTLLAMADETTGQLVVPRAAPVVLRSGALGYDPRVAGGFRDSFVTSRGGWVSLVRERTLKTEAVAVCIDPRPMHFAPVSGQSNAINGGTADVNPRKLVTPLYPHHVVGMTYGISHRFITPAGDTFLPKQVDGFLPFQDYPSANGQGAMCVYGFGIEGAYRAAGAPSPGIVGYTSAKGGSPITEHNQGTLVYSNMIAAATRAREIAALYGRDLVCHALRFIQGEGGPYTGYQALLEELGDDYQADLATALGGNGGIDPVLLVDQISATDTTDNPVNVVQLDQVAAARNRPDVIKLAGPMYINRMDDGGIHGATDSKMMIHEAAGYAYRQLVEEGAWEPLWSADGTASRTGNVIAVDYNVPGVDRMLEWDPGVDAPEADGWIKPITNYGFFYADDSSGVTIATVEIGKFDGFATRVTITLTGDPGAAANKVLSYARHAYDTDEDLWASARGQLRCRLEKSDLRDQGLPIPYWKYAYAIAEEWSV